MIVYAALISNLLFSVWMLYESLIDPDDVEESKIASIMFGSFSALNVVALFYNIYG